MERPIPSLRVQIGSEIVLRRAEPQILEQDLVGRVTVVRLRPQLRPNEILCERPGDIPVIVTDPSALAATPPTQVVDFDIWMKQRIDLAHAEFMKRTSRRLWCDWRAVATPEDVAGIYGIATNEVTP